MRTGNRAGRAGIIAAGRGERLQTAGLVKPLVSVAGRPLIDHVLGSMADAGVAEVVIIINDASLAVREHVEAGTWPFDVRWIVASTPSSMHSFLLVVEALDDGSNDSSLISTVDTIVPPGAFTRFVQAADGTSADVTLALTAHVDDEKPLLVELADEARTHFITGSGRLQPAESPPKSGHYQGYEIDAGGVVPAGPQRVVRLGMHARGPLATAGYYLVRRTILKEADRARSEGVSALRAFLDRLLQRGYRIDGVVMPASIDVDIPSDVTAADRFLRVAGNL